MAKTKVKKVDTLPKFFTNVLPATLGLVSKPFGRGGNHKACVTIMSFFLDDKPKKKLDILVGSGMLKEPEGKNLGSYGTKYFSSLNRVKAIKYDTYTQKWERGENFNGYLTYLIECMLETKGKEKVHSLLTAEQIERTTSNINAVVLEMLQDKATVSTLKRIWRGTEDSVQDFIINSDDD